MKYVKNIWFQQQIPDTRGKVGGVTSLFNYMNYLRVRSKHDYDSQAEDGIQVQSFNDVETYFKKVEHATDPELSDSLGRNGMIKLSRYFMNPNLNKLIMNTADELGIIMLQFIHIFTILRITEYPVVDYLDGGGLLEGFSNLTVNTWKGKRQSSAVAYLWLAWEERYRSYELF